MAKPGVMFYFEIRPCIKRLTLEEKGKLFEAILDYGEFGTIPEVDGALGVAWDFIQPNLDRDTERYERQVEQKQYAAFVRDVKKKGIAPPSIDTWRGLSDIERQRLISADIGRYPTNNLQTTTNNLQTTTSKDNKESVADKPPTRHRFSPPTVDDVRAYCAENGYGVDPERFVDFYESNGWMVGKNHMKDWKAAVRSWERKENPNGKTESKPIWTVGTVV